MLSVQAFREAVWDRLTSGPVGQEVIAEHRYAELRTRADLVAQIDQARADFPAAYERLSTEESKAHQAVPKKLTGLLAECPPVVLDEIERMLRNHHLVPCELQNRVGEAFAPWHATRADLRDHQHRYDRTISRAEGTLRDLDDEVGELVRDFVDELRATHDKARAEGIYASTQVDVKGIRHVDTNGPEVTARGEALRLAERQTLAMRFEALSIDEARAKVEAMRRDLIEKGVRLLTAVQYVPQPYTAA